ncbi:MAG TPA: hemerythrin domain-containing protein [Stellaceae bacterium]|nr:hemerythrin domain-containing protein [Stellaceae bacterium]
MSATESFRKQHVELIELVKSVEDQLKPEIVAQAAGEIRQKLSRLFGKLSLHLAMEDNSLYPRCQKHADANVQGVAKRFAEEMTGVKPAVEAFAREWSETQIKAEPARFSAEAKRLFGVLADRIRRENTEFYALLDQAERNPQTAAA